MAVAEIAVRTRPTGRPTRHVSKESIAMRNETKLGFNSKLSCGRLWSVRSSLPGAPRAAAAGQRERRGQLATVARCSP